MIASPAQPAVKNSATAQLAPHFDLISGEVAAGWNQGPQVPFVPGVAIGWAEISFLSQLPLTAGLTLPNIRRKSRPGTFPPGESARILWILLTRGNVGCR